MPDFESRYVRSSKPRKDENDSELDEDSEEDSPD